MPGTALDWSRYRAVSGRGDEVDASRLSRSPDPAERAMAEAMARDHAMFTPYDDGPMPLWQRVLAWAVWGWIGAGFLASALGVLWLLMAYVAPAIPKLAAWLIQTGGMIVTGWLL